jgi:hypothetical protein
MCNKTYIWSLEEKMENLAKHASVSLQNTSSNCCASMALHNYIRRKSIQDVAFNEFDRHPDFVLADTLTDVVTQTRGHQRASRMDYVRDGIATSLMRQ